MPELTEHEAQVLEMLTGDRKGEWGAWVGACLESLEGMDYCIKKGHRYVPTDAGLSALAHFRSKENAPR